LNDDFDAVLEHPGVIARQIGIRALCDTCSGCELAQTCGGGHYVHRYRHDTGFRNPSVYCADLWKLITHVRNRLEADLAPLRYPRKVHYGDDVAVTPTAK
jgi:uncharacterized protein